MHYITGTYFFSRWPEFTVRWYTRPVIYYGMYLNFEASGPTLNEWNVLILLLFYNDLDLNNQKTLCLPSIFQFDRKLGFWTTLTNRINIECRNGNNTRNLLWTLLNCSDENRVLCKSSKNSPESQSSAVTSVFSLLVPTKPSSAMEYPAFQLWKKRFSWKINLHKPNPFL